MGPPAEPSTARVEAPRTTAFLRGLGRAFAGALIFTLPILMTMEMWQLGYTMEPLKLMVLIALTLPLLVRLSRYEGFRVTGSLMDDIADALVAVVVSAIAFVLVLAALGVFDRGTTLEHVVNATALQAVPGSIGAMLAQNQLGDQDVARRSDASSYDGELFLMIVGALFLSFSVAPTEEVVLIAHRLEPWQELLLVLGTIALMHAFVYALEFRGSEAFEEGAGFLKTFVKYTVAGYGLVLLVSLVVLWLFGRTEGIGLSETVSTAVVLSFPGAIGAAAARLIL